MAKKTELTEANACIAVYADGQLRVITGLLDAAHGRGVANSAIPGGRHGIICRDRARGDIATTKVIGVDEPPLTASMKSLDDILTEQPELAERISVDAVLAERKRRAEEEAARLKAEAEKREAQKRAAEIKRLALEKQEQEFLEQTKRWEREAAEEYDRRKAEEDK